MDFLTLCQRTAYECGIPAAAPLTVINQTGQSQRIVNWVESAWTDIQAAHQDWDWLRTSTSFTTTAGQPFYTLGTGSGTVEVATTTFGMWERYTFRNYDTSFGTNSEVTMQCIDYDVWRDRYYLGALRSTQTRPLEFAIRQDKAICLGPPPISGYTITGDYFLKPVTLAADADIPALPTQWHLAIVYRAMMFYGGYEAANEVYQRGELEFTKMMRRMTVDRLPQATFGGALA